MTIRVVTYYKIMTNILVFSLKWQYFIIQNLHTSTLHFQILIIVYKYLIFFYAKIDLGINCWCGTLGYMTNNESCIKDKPPPIKFGTWNKNKVL